MKEPDGWIDIGAVVRLAPIKDIKTMLYSFYELAQQVPNVRLHIMGGIDDQEYADECLAWPIRWTWEVVSYSLVGLIFEIYEEN